MRPERRPARIGPRHGFTLVELVIAMVIFGILAATLATFLPPAMAGFIATRTRAAIVDDADNVLRRMERDVQVAVPHSIRAPSTDCFELVPTSASGRARRAEDTVNAGSAGLDSSGGRDLDLLLPLAVTPVVGDRVVLDDANPTDVYAGLHRSVIQEVGIPAAAAGWLRLSIASLPVPSGHDSGVFFTVPAQQQAVFYVCSGADGTLDPAGNGKGRLFRLANYGLNAAAPTACPDTTGAPVMATHVRRCRFIVDPNPNSVRHNGFVSIELELARNGETAPLLLAAQVGQAP